MNGPSSRISRALELHQSGQFDAARDLYRQALSDNPEDRDALHLLGVLQLQSGDALNAMDLLQKASAQPPADPQILANLGNACFAAGRLDDAVAAFRRSLELNAHAPESWASLGNAHLTMNNADQAIECYERALHLNPALAEVWRGLSSALLEVDQPARALTAIDRAQVELSGAGQPVSPPFVMTHGNVLMALGRTEDALSRFEQVVTAVPTFAQAYVSRGNAQRDLGRADAALTDYLRATELAPESTEAQFALALSYKDQGRLDDARTTLDRVLSINESHGKAHRVLAGLTRYTTEHSHLLTLQRLANSDALADGDREHVCFALGKALEDCGLYEEAFARISEANQLHRQSIRYSPEHEEQQVSEIMRVFNQAQMENGRSSGSSHGPIPVFVVGMPRSGTSLIEQILASHPAVYGAGELEWVDMCTREHFDLTRDSVAASESRVETSARQAGDIGRAYRRRIGDRLTEANRADAGWFVDKLPANFRHVGLIRLALPEAVIVHSQRQPVATCWSIFKNYLGARGHSYSFELTELGHYYRLYRRLMAHWDSVLPGEIRQVRYEDLVADQEVQSRKLLAECGLEWHDDCLEFYQTRRQVKTLSATQVRRPIYTDSIAQWRHYERQLQPLIRALDQH